MNKENYDVQYGMFFNGKFCILTVDPLLNHFHYVQAGTLTARSVDEVPNWGDHKKLNTKIANPIHYFIDGNFIKIKLKSKKRNIAQLRDGRFFVCGNGFEAEPATTIPGWRNLRFLQLNLIDIFALDVKKEIEPTKPQNQEAETLKGMNQHLQNQIDQKEQEIVDLTLDLENARNEIKSLKGRLEDKCVDQFQLELTINRLKEDRPLTFTQVRQLLKDCYNSLKEA